LKKLLFTTEHPAPYMDELFDGISDAFGVDVVYIQAASEEKNWASFNARFVGHLANDISTIRLVRMIREADLVIVGGWSRFFNVKTLLIGLITGTKTAIFSDAPNIEAKKSIVRFVQSLLLKIVPWYFVTGGEAGRIFAKTYWIDDLDRIKDFPYQSWLPDAEDVDQHIALRAHTLRAPNGLVRVFIANRFIERKGYPDVIEALHYLQSAGVLNAFHFDIAGNGPDFERFREIFLRDFPKVELHGWIEIDDYRRLMLGCDVFVHASRFEPYGLPVIDACNCQKRVIATSGVCAAVDAKNAGYPVLLFEPGDGRTLGALMEQVCTERYRLYHAAKIETGAMVFAPQRNLASLKEVLAPFREHEPPEP
jgi:glycosyltransferase involved in cell wall biosynthesis